jgi:GrpB-like predicted nucleotidyltransferase (UPF0157 family)
LAIVIVIEPYDHRWETKFRELGHRLREALGPLALAIHHIGSTSVPGLAAKDVIDVQVTVASLDAHFVRPLIEAGLEYRRELRKDHVPPGVELADVELEKRCFKAADPRANIHIRAAGRFNQRYPLLCRDYLRSSKDTACAYAEIKRQLARHFPNDPEAYYDVKDPVFDLIMAGASNWAKLTGWREPPSDA